jgi:acetylornithine deacetylase
MAAAQAVDLEKRVVDVLIRLIELNSVNPALEDDAGGEAAVAALVEQHCMAAGLEIGRHSVLPGRENVFASLRVPGASQTLLLESHMDTVALASMGERALRPEVRDGRVYGRGACDDKGSLAAMMVAMEILAARRSELRVNVLLVAAIDEEYHFRGVMDIVDRKVPVDGAVVGEPTDLRLVVAHKGVVRLRLSTLGVAAHSSKPELGTSAIEHMAEVVLAVRDLQRELEKRPHPLAGHPTLNVGLISGGVAVNIVPERCTIELERRIVPGEDWDTVLAEVDQTLGQLKSRNPRIRIEREDPLLTTPALATPYDAPVVLAVQQACREVEVNDSLSGVPFGSDASKLWHYGGVPSVVLGPGSIDQAHTCDEYVPVDQLSLATEIYVKTALAWPRR